MATSAARDEKPQLIGPTRKLAKKPRKTARKAPRKVARRRTAKKRK